MSGPDYFKVKKPCPDCPFRRSSPGGWLGREFATEIVDNLHTTNEKGGSAPLGCHVTTGAVDGRGVHQPTEGEDLGRAIERGESACAGSVHTSFKEDDSRWKTGRNLLARPMPPVFQIAIALGILDQSSIITDDSTFDSMDEFIEHHARADKYPGYSERRGDVPFNPPKGIA